MVYAYRLVAVYFKVKAASYQRLISELRRQLRFERRVEKRKVFATGRAMSTGNGINLTGINIIT